MAETHPLRSPSQTPTDPTFADWNRQAEDLARRCRPAEMPPLNHLRTSDYANVYEPSDDTFLLLDGLSVDLFDGGVGGCGDDDDGRGGREGEGEGEDNIRITLELGSGTGVVTTFLATVLRDRRRRRRTRPRRGSGCDAAATSSDTTGTRGSSTTTAVHYVHYATDVNLHAVRTTLRTADAANLPARSIDAIQCDLATPLLPHLAGQVDVLIFNPPYVPTPDEEVGSDGIEASWAGGTDGRVVLDRALPQIAKLLRWPHGAAYVITVDDNMPEDLAKVMARDYGVIAKPLVRRKARNEYLTVLKMTLGRRLDSHSGS